MSTVRQGAERKRPFKDVSSTLTDEDSEGRGASDDSYQDPFVPLFNGSGSTEREDGE